MMMELSSVLDIESQHLEDLKELKSLVEDENDLYLGEDDNRILFRFLHYTNFDVEKAFNKLKTVYRLKFDHPKWYAHEVFSNAQKIALSRQVHCVLPDRDQKGRRIYILRLGNVVVGEVEPWEMFQTDDLWLELAMDEPETQANGLVYIFDMKGLSWKYITYFTPHNCKVASSKAEDIPANKMEYHVINSGILLNTLVTIVFPFLSSSTKQNVHMHKSDMTSLHKYVTPDILPKEYGGKLPSLDYIQLQKYISHREHRLRELVSYGYRPSK